MLNETEIMEGTTTLAILCSDGVVLGTEQRATMGHYIATKEAKKVYQIADTIAMTIAGGVGDAQSLVRMLSIEAKSYEIHHRHKITINALSTFLSHILQANKLFPYGVQLIIGGKDENGFHINSIDAYGGVNTEKDITSSGSGSMIAYGVLEDAYHPDIDCDSGTHLAIRALTSAIKRDSASGENIDIVVISNGYERLPREVIKKLISEREVLRDGTRSI